MVEVVAVVAVVAVAEVTVAVAVEAVVVVEVVVVLVALLVQCCAMPDGTVQCERTLKVGLRRSMVKRPDCRSTKPHAAAL